MKLPYRNLLSSSLALLAVASAYAQTTFTWDQAAGGAQSWTTASNWDTDPVVPAPVSGDIIDFSTFNITANTQVTLEADRTAGLWKFGDTSGTTTWTVNAGNSITLAGTTPTIQVNNGTAILKNEVAGTQGLTKSGGGTLILEGVSDSFTGDIEVTGGILRIGNNNTTSRLGGLTYAGNIGLNGGSIDFESNTTQTLSGIISGTGIFDRGGSGILTLSGANTYTGQTKIQGSGGGGPGLSVSSFNSVNETETGAVMASSSLGAPTTVAAGTILFGNSGNQRSSTLIYTGSGETTNRVMAVGFNSGSSHQLYSSGTGLLKFTSAFVISKSSGNNGSGLTLRGDGDGEIAAGIVGDAIPGRLDKDDAGTWTINGTLSANSSTINAGTLILNGSLTTVSTTVGSTTYERGSITVNSGATLGGSATIDGAITIQNGGTLSVGNSPGQMIIAELAAGSLALGATSNMLMELGGTTLGTEYDNLTMGAMADALTYGGNLNVVNFGLYDMDASSFVYDLFSLGLVTPTGDFASVTVNSILLSNSGGLWTGVNGDVTYEFSQALGDLSIVAIPEPSSLVLLGGFGALLLARRRR